MRNSQAILGIDNTLSTPNKYQLDMLEYTYPYHMKNIAMKPYNCHGVTCGENSTYAVESMINSLNAHHPSIQLKVMAMVTIIDDHVSKGS